VQRPYQRSSFHRRHRPLARGRNGLLIPARSISARGSNTVLSQICAEALSAYRLTG
jgi:hypothetical protein